MDFIHSISYLSQPLSSVHPILLFFTLFIPILLIFYLFHYSIPHTPRFLSFFFYPLLVIVPLLLLTVFLFPLKAPTTMEIFNMEFKQQKVPISKINFWFQKILLILLVIYFAFLGKSLSTTGNFNSVQTKYFTDPGLPIFGFQNFFSPSPSTSSNNPSLTPSILYKITYFILGAVSTYFAGSFYPSGLFVIYTLLGILFFSPISFSHKYFAWILPNHAEREPQPNQSPWIPLLQKWILRIFHMFVYMGFDVPTIEKRKRLEKEEEVRTFLGHFFKTKLFAWLFANLVPLLLGSFIGGFSTFTSITFQIIVFMFIAMTGLSFFGEGKTLWDSKFGLLTS